jgi:hypothetical protein
MDIRDDRRIQIVLPKADLVRAAKLLQPDNLSFSAVPNTGARVEVTLDKDGSITMTYWVPKASTIVGAGGASGFRRDMPPFGSAAAVAAHHADGAPLVGFPGFPLAPTHQAQRDSNSTWDPPIGPHG